jgi:hypothetical protein
VLGNPQLVGYQAVQIWTGTQQRRDQPGCT